MKHPMRLAGIVFLSAAALSAATLFTSPSQSNWSVSKGKSVIGKATLTTDGAKVRVDWKPSAGTPSSFVAADGKLWVKSNSGDADFSTYRDPVGRTVAPALLLPVTTGGSSRVATSGSKATTYNFEGVSAAYTYDAKGAVRIDLTSGSEKYTLTRDSLAAGVGNSAGFYEVKGKSSRLAGLKGMAGGLLGSSDNSVSASAGVRGMDDKTALEAGIDLSQVETLLDRDKAQKTTDSATLKKFQKEGKVGGAQ